MKDDQPHRQITGVYGETNEESRGVCGAPGFHGGQAVVTEEPLRPSRRPILNVARAILRFKAPLEQENASCGLVSFGSRHIAVCASVGSNMSAHTGAACDSPS